MRFLLAMLIARRPEVWGGTLVAGLRASRDAD
jgi:hypothetical protein